MRNKIMTGALALALGTLGVVGTAGAANADACPSTKLCAYAQTNYNGTPGQVQYNNDNLLQYYSFANAASVSNSGTQCSVTIYSGTGGTGSSVVIPRGYGIGDLSGTAFYHSVASDYWC
ncbi:peptidase inhibitor family I36 protein [Kitasatospora sp. NPDC093558]|uniref:peptidase inhibitor family I36 protein n=1 Tax=Kitasatospora sp. NPDC093558 TaxID=3155201 RepID=UPI003424E31F